MTTKQPRRRWFRITPDRFLLGLLAVEGILLLSERFRWFPFNEHKNWTVLIALGVVCVAVVLLLLWFSVSLVLRRRFQFSLRSLLMLVVVVAVVLHRFFLPVDDDGDDYGSRFPLAVAFSLQPPSFQVFFV